MLRHIYECEENHVVLHKVPFSYSPPSPSRWAKKLWQKHFIEKWILTAVYWTKFFRCSMMVSASSFNCFWGISSDPNLNNTSKALATMFGSSLAQYIYYSQILLFKISVQVVPLRIFAAISKTNHFSRKDF